jgi:hypothetical protein
MMSDSQDYSVQNTVHEVPHLRPLADATRKRKNRSGKPRRRPLRKGPPPHADDEPVPDPESEEEPRDHEVDLLA